MWGLFFFTVAIVAVSLFAPGYVMLRGFGVARTLSVSFTPLVGVGAYVVLGLAFAMADVRSSWVSQTCVLVALAAAVYAVARFKRGRARADVAFGLADHGAVCGGCIGFDAACLAGYVLVGVVFAGVLFVWYLGSPDSYAQQFDNISHLGTIQAFVDSGAWSPFSASLYASVADAAINPLPGGGFYPTAWYSVAALAVTSTGVSVSCAENVANFVFVALVLPASAFGFMRVLFDGNRSVVPFGAACTLLFAGFPWMLIFFGPLYPNLSAFCMVPAAAAVFLLLFKPGCSRTQRVGLACLFAVAMVSLALAQPNAVFTLAVLLAPFCIWQSSRIPLLLSVNGAVRAALRVACGAIAFAAVTAIWMALYNAPFLASVVQHMWLPYASRFEVFQDALVCGFMADGSQIVLAVLIIVGAARTLWDRRYLWLSFSYAFACLIYVVNGYSDGPLKHIFGGFWYTDPWRCGAMASLIGMFLAALGVWTVWRGVLWACKRVRKAPLPAAAGSAVAVALACLTVLGSTFPGVAAPGSQSGAIAFRSVLSGLHAGATHAEVYDDAEQAFVQEVEQVVPDDALIINVPDDGSAFAFAADGLRTYFRYTREYDVPKETPESRIIRNSLRNIADNAYVQDAVRAVGAQYVLQLDQGEPGVESPHLFTYENGKKWCGIDGIRDDTPGFEVVLAKGDMRLYKITAAYPGRPAGFAYRLA